MRAIRTKLAVLLLLCFAVAAGCSTDTKIPKALNWELENFQYTDQDGKPFGLQDLKGKVWVTDFIFTNCATVCPPMTANMTKLQQMAQDEKLDIEIVSFSVDPEVDQPDMLKAYIEKFQADPTNWHLLTGYSQEEIKRFAKENFQQLVDKPQSDTQVIHGTSFFLVDQNGKVMKKYSGVSNVPYEDIIRDIKRLLR